VEESHASAPSAWKARPTCHTLAVDERQAT
jgi:hypothetical protein